MLKMPRPTATAIIARCFCHAGPFSWLAREVAARSDVLLFVCEGDLTDVEHRALESLARLNRPVLLVLNKADRYTASERALLLER